jgi:surface antigen
MNQPVLVEPVIYPSQTWNDTSVAYVANPITKVSTSVKTPQYPKSGEQIQSQVKKKNQKLSKPNCALYAKARTGIVTNAPYAALTIAYAKKAGYETTKDKPVVGAIGQTKEGPVKHVFVVEEVKGNKVRTSEDNFPVKSRWVDINDPIMDGFVLPKG